MTFMPDLTTVRQDIDRIGELAAQSIIALINGDNPESNIKLPVELIEGKTAQFIPCEKNSSNASDDRSPAYVNRLPTTGTAKRRIDMKTFDI